MRRRADDRIDLYAAAARSVVSAVNRVCGLLRSGAEGER